MLKLDKVLKGDWLVIGSISQPQGRLQEYYLRKVYSTPSLATSVSRFSLAPRFAIKI
jgi:hypothetical protein